MAIYRYAETTLSARFRALEWTSKGPNDGSRMTRECHVRFCEGLAVRFRRSTHPYLASAPVTRRDAAYDVQAWVVCREEVETFTRFRLPGEGGNRNQIQRWCRGDNRQSGRRLIQPQTPDLTITPDMANMWKLSFH